VMYSAETLNANPKLKVSSLNRKPTAQRHQHALIHRGPESKTASSWGETTDVDTCKGNEKKSLFENQTLVLPIHLHWGHLRTEEFRGSLQLPFTLAKDLTERELKENLYGSGCFPNLKLLTAI
jgi:hypothetical protein